MTEPLRSAFVVDALRTPIGRYGGALARVRPDDLAALVIKAIVQRNGVDPARIDDVIFGCTNQAGEDNRNVARMAALIAGLPVCVPAVTVNRLCASGLQALADAANQIATGQADIVIAGGVESMSRAPLVMAKPDKAFPRGDGILHDTTLGWRMVNPLLRQRVGTESLGETAEIVADLHNVSRAAQDAFALRSQQKCEAAQSAGAFDREIVAVEVPDAHGRTTTVQKDEHPRPGITLEKLSVLKPVFRPQGTVTAGNASGINDGAAALLVASEEGMRALGVQPSEPYRVVGAAVAGVEPRLMGLGPIPATQKLFQKTGLQIKDVDLVEMNEAFAAQAIPCLDALRIEAAKVNVNGGAIALGHPLGCTGARMATTLLHALRARNASRGIATLCIGVGQGMALMIERA